MKTVTPTRRLLLAVSASLSLLAGCASQNLEQ